MAIWLLSYDLNGNPSKMVSALNVKKIARPERPNPPPETEGPEVYRLVNSGLPARRHKRRQTVRRGPVGRK